MMELADDDSLFAFLFIVGKEHEMNSFREFTRIVIAAETLLGEDRVKASLGVWPVAAREHLGEA